MKEKIKKSFYQNEKIGGIPWQSSGWDSLLSLLWAVSSGGTKIHVSPATKQKKKKGKKIYLYSAPFQN